MSRFPLRVALTAVLLSGCLETTKRMPDSGTTSDAGVDAQVAEVDAGRAALSLTLGADQMRIVPSEQSSFSVTVDRNAGDFPITEDVVVSVSGLPLGVAVADLQLEGGAFEGEMVVQVSASTAPTETFVELIVEARSGDTSASRRLLLLVPGHPGTRDATFAAEPVVAVPPSQYSDLLVDDADTDETGKLWVVGNARNGGVAATPFVTRLDADGSWNRDFGTQGVAPPQPGFSAPSANRVEAIADGAIVAMHGNLDNTSSLFRVDGEGDWVGTFGSAGRVYPAWDWSVDGDAVFVRENTTVVRRELDGSLDNRFTGATWSEGVPLFVGDGSGGLFVAEDWVCCSASHIPTRHLMVDGSVDGAFAPAAFPIATDTAETGSLQHLSFQRGMLWAATRAASTLALYRANADGSATEPRSSTGSSARLLPLASRRRVMVGASGRVFVRVEHAGQQQLLVVDRHGTFASGPVLTVPLDTAMIFDSDHERVTTIGVNESARRLVIDRYWL